MEEVMLTTIDNPWNPWTNFDEWYQYDVEKGYYTSSYLARIARTSDDMSEADIDLAERTAIADILRLNVLGIYTTISEHEAAPKTESS